MKQSDAPMNIDIQRFSSLTKLLRVTALVLQFISKLMKTAPSIDQIDSELITQAETLWICYVQGLHYDDVISAIQNYRKRNIIQQLWIYKDSKNILRCRGRLENADLTEGARLPVLLPKHDKYTALLIEKVHKKFASCWSFADIISRSSEILDTTRSVSCEICVTEMLGL